MYMSMQVYDSGQCQCKQDQHYTQTVSLSCNHPNGDGWPALSTGRRDVERARPKAVLAHIIILSLLLLYFELGLQPHMFLTQNVVLLLFHLFYYLLYYYITGKHDLWPHSLRVASPSGQCRPSITIWVIATLPGYSADLVCIVMHLHAHTYSYIQLHLHHVKSIAWSCLSLANTPVPKPSKLSAQ